MKTNGKEAKKSAEAVSYDEFKEFEGKRYTGMKIGRSHKWYYDQGEWKEKKITPDLWQINYAVTKRRAGRAPEGSGVPVGTEYHWYLVAHQNVEKLNANDYTTSLAGLKFKIAHKRAGSGQWSASTAAQRRRMIKFLREVIADLEAPPEESAAPAPAPARKAAPPKKAPAKRARKMAVPKTMKAPARRRKKTEA
ncbi:MAG: hypothetical protein ACT443_02920 [Gemmatimonadota bacterium]